MATVKALRNHRMTPLGLILKKGEDCEVPADFPADILEDLIASGFCEKKAAPKKAAASSAD